MNASKRPYLLGLTGGIASGKSTVTDLLIKQGATVIDGDVLSHRLTQDGGQALPLIRERFSDRVFADDGRLDRRVLGEIVFHDEEARRALEGILHPMVQGLMMDQIEEAGERGEKLCVLAVPLLFETGIDALCDEVWVISLEPEEQLKRLMNRDKLTREQAIARINAQMDRAERDGRADTVITNNRTEQDLAREVKQKYQALLSRIAASKG